MAEVFDSICFEVYISGAWVDISADVMAMPYPTWNRGIMGNDQLARVADPGYLTFDLNNSETNSAGLVGYYSPGHTNALSGWTTGLPIRVCFTYETQTYYKFYGRIAPDGILVDLAVYGSKRVHVTAIDWMAQAAKHELQLLALLENKRIDEVMPYIIANMPIAPLDTDYKTGVYTFPTVFDTVKGKTSAIAEFQKLANSELSTIYVRGDKTGGEVLTAEANTTRLVSTTEISINRENAGFLLQETGDKILQETGDAIILNETQNAEFTDADMMPGTRITYGRNIANRVEVITYPRNVDATPTTVLWNLQTPFSIDAGETKTGYYCRYRDPSGGASYVNGRDMVAMSTDSYEAWTTSTGGAPELTSDLSITATFGTEAASFDLTNNGAGTLYVTKLQAVGRGIYLYDPVRVVYESSDSQATHGVYVLSLDQKYQNDPTVGENFAINLLAREKDPDYKIDQAVIFANRDGRSMYSFLELNTGKRMKITNTMTGTEREYFVQGYRAEIREGKYVMWMPVLQFVGDISGTWVLGSSMLSVNTTLAAG